MEREKEYEKRLAELDDVVPGEERTNEAELAVKKSIMSIKSVRIFAFFFEFSIFVERIRCFCSGSSIFMHFM